MFTISKDYLEDFSLRNWSNLMWIIIDSAYFKQRYWNVIKELFYWGFFCTPFSRREAKKIIDKFLEELTYEEEIIIIKKLIKLIFRKTERVSIEEYSLPPFFENLARDDNSSEFFHTDHHSLPSMKTAGEEDKILTEDDIKEEDIAMIKKNFQIIEDGRASILLPKLLQQRQEHQQELTNLHQAHSEFLDTQLNFYQQTKPKLWAEFANSNPASLDIGNLLNFLESKLQQQQQGFKNHLTNWITLITNRYNRLSS